MIKSHGGFFIIMEKNEILARAKKYISEEQDDSFRKEVEKLVAEENLTEL